MKLNSCTTIELKNLRQRSIEKLARLADRIGRIDAILTVRKYNDLEEDLIQAGKLAVYK